MDPIVTIIGVRFIAFERKTILAIPATNPLRVVAAAIIWITSRHEVVTSAFWTIHR